MDALSAIAFVAERKIEEAIADGVFDNLPGMGKPLELEDLSHLPPDMRMAYTILKNSGHLDEKKQNERELSMRDLLASAEEERACYAKMQRLKVLMGRVERVREGASSEALVESQSPAADENSPYLEKILNRL